MKLLWVLIGCCCMFCSSVQGSLPSKDTIAAFREWLKKVPYLNHDVDDYFISAFILAAKGRMEKAKATFDNFHHVRIKHPELFANLDPIDPVVLQNNTVGYLSLAPTVSKDGCLVLCGALTDTDYTKFNLCAVYRSFHMIALEILMDPNTPIKYGEKWNGKIRLVWDMANYRLGHLAMYTPSLVKAAMEYLSSAIPMRMAGMHVVNVSPAVERLVSFMKTFLKKKIADRIQIHSNLKDLQEYLPDYVLPIDFGGKLPSGNEMRDDLHAKLLAFRPVILDWEEKMRQLEKLRPQKQEDIIVGSFRKLEVD